MHLWRTTWIETCTKCQIPPEAPLPSTSHGTIQTSTNIIIFQTINYAETNPFSLKTPITYTITNQSSKTITTITVISIIIRFSETVKNPSHMNSLTKTKFNSLFIITGPLFLISAIIVSETTPPLHKKLIPKNFKKARKLLKTTIRPIQSVNPWIETLMSTQF